MARVDGEESNVEIIPASSLIFDTDQLTEIVQKIEHEGSTPPTHL